MITGCYQHADACQLVHYDQNVFESATFVGANRHEIQGDYFHRLCCQQLVPHRARDPMPACQFDTLEAPCEPVLHLLLHTVPNEAITCIGFVASNWCPIGRGILCPPANLIHWRHRASQSSTCFCIPCQMKTSPIDEFFGVFVFAVALLSLVRYCYYVDA